MLLVCALFPLIWVGGLVTTYDAGMAVPDWPNTYGYNLLLYPWQTWILGPWDLFIEHGHRLLGAAAGLVAIGLAVVTWRCESRGWVRGLGLAMLAAVVAQGVLGGMRVLLDERVLAMLHGTTGPAVFALATGLATCTSARWRTTERRTDAGGSALARLALVTTLLAYLQLVIGAGLRHRPLVIDAAAFRALVLFHLLIAAMLLLHIGLIVWRAATTTRRDPWLVRPAAVLGLLIVVQLLLGAATWVTNYGWPAWLSAYPWAAAYVPQARSALQSHVTTAHVAAGSLILVTSLLLALRAVRSYRAPARSSHPAWLLEVAT